MEEAMQEYHEACERLKKLGERYRSGEDISVAQIEAAVRRKLAAAEMLRRVAA